MSVLGIKGSSLPYTWCSTLYMYMRIRQSQYIYIYMQKESKFLLWNAPAPSLTSEISRSASSYSAGILHWLQQIASVLALDWYLNHRVIYIYNYTWSISSHNVSQLNHWSLCLKKIQATFLFFHFFLNHCPNTSLFLSVSLYDHSWHFCPLNHTYKHKGWLFNPSLFLPNSTYFPCSSISPVKTLLVLNLHRQKIT